MNDVNEPYDASRSRLTTTPELKIGLRLAFFESVLTFVTVLPIASSVCRTQPDLDLAPNETLKKREVELVTERKAYLPKTKCLPS